MSFLAPSDFVGIVAQSTNTYTESDIQLYINKFEPKYLTDLLGATMYAAFVADLTPTPAVVTSVPVDAKFTIIFNSFAIDETLGSGCQHISEGMREMLKYFIFFHYARDNQFDFSIAGATKNQFSNAELMSINHTNAIDNYNLGVKTYEQIQWYICDNPVPYDYDDYNGLKKEFISWL
jgi:hypothetical protein